MFNERSMQQQLKNFQKQSQVQPQRLQAQPFPSHNIQPIHVMPQGAQQHYQQQGVYQQHYPQNVTAASSGAPRWQAQQQYQSGVPQNNMANPTFQHHHQNNQPQVQQNPKSAPPPSKGGKHRAISLPPWLEKSICRSVQHNMNVEPETPSQQAVRELYTRALGLVECTTFTPDNSNDAAGASNICGCCKQCASLPTAWVETERVSLLLLRTGVPAGMLALLWELVNCSRPGQLTRRECTALLALIALVQSGQQLVSADVLLKLPEPVVPVIDHPALLPFLQQFQQQQQQQQQHLASLAKANNTESVDNDDEFDDFVAATQPCPPVNSINNNINNNTNNNNFFAANATSSSNCERVNNQATTVSVSSQSIPAFTPQSSLNQTLFPSSIPPSNSVQGNVAIAPIPTTSQSLSVPNNTAASDKRMNLPQVGRSPDMSPSLSFDNSQEDDFDDFQSATSDPSGLVSTDGSPRMATGPKSDTNAVSSNSNQEAGNDAVGNIFGTIAKLPGTCIKLPASSGKSDNSSVSLGSSHSASSSSNGILNNHHSTDKTHSSERPTVSGGVLQPAMVAMQSSDGDRYAALRGFDFGVDSPAPTLAAGGMDLLNDAATSPADDSFGDFCSVEKGASTVDDDFGEFAAANFEKLTMPDVLQSTNSSNNTIKQPQVIPEIPSLKSFSVSIQKPISDNPLHVDFDADFSSLDLSYNSHRKSPNPVFGIHSLPNIPSEPATNTDNWASGFDLKPSASGITDFFADTSKQDNAADDLKTNSSNGLKTDRQDTVVPAVGKASKLEQSGEKKTIPSSTGPSNWSDIFGVLHDHKQPPPPAAAVPAPASPTVSMMPWSEEPPPLPNCGDNDDLAELNDDFGEFLGPSSSAPPTSEDACIKPPAPPFILSQDNTATSPSTAAAVGLAAPPPFSFPVCEPPAIITDADSSAPKLEAVAAGKGANVAAVLSTISEPLPLDKYSSIREDSGPCSGGGGAEECWQRCLEGCQQVLRAAVVALEPLAAEDMNGSKVANTQPLRDYLAGLLEVVCVSARVRAASHSLPVNDSLQTSLSLVSDLQDQLITALQANVQDSVFVESMQSVDSSIPKTGHSFELPGELCAVCLTLISDGASSCSSISNPGTVLSSKLSSPSPPSVDPCRSSQGSSLQYGGHSYHPGCANLWLNCVDLTLPALSASSATLL